MNATTQVHVRWSIRMDLPAVVEIDRVTSRFPWTETDFLNALRMRSVIGMVAESNDRIAGFVLYELFPHHLEIRNLAVHPEFQSQGVGSHIVDRMRGKLSTHRRTSLAATVRESNTGGQLFLRAMGFKARHFYRALFPDTGEGGVVFEWRMDSSDPKGR